MEGKRKSYGQFSGFTISRLMRSLLNWDGHRHAHNFPPRLRFGPKLLFGKDTLWYRPRRGLPVKRSSNTECIVTSHLGVWTLPAANYLLENHHLDIGGVLHVFQIFPILLSPKLSVFPLVASTNQKYFASALSCFWRSRLSGSWINL